jgi:hypothetical protein
MNSNQGKLKHEINDIIEIPDYEREQIEDINEEIDENDGDGDRSISRSRFVDPLNPDPYHHIQRIGALGKTGNINYPSDIFVFVLDTGVYKHKDLNINTQYSKDFTGNPRGWDDFNGHGTHVSGIIGAKDSKFAVAPGVQIIMHKVLGDNGRGDTQSILNSLNEIKTFKTNNPSAKIVVNLSFGEKITRGEAVLNNYKKGNVTGPPPILRLHEELIIELIKEGITFIIGAGNDTADTSVGIPARIPEAITVGAYSSVEVSRVFKFNSIANFSNFGSLIDIMAPGVNIYSTWLDNSYRTISGTSMATPIVTGAVVNMIAVESIKNPNKILTPQEIKNRLRSDAENTANIKNAENTSINEKIQMYSYYDYGLCWKPPSEFTVTDCFTWWLSSTRDEQGNIIVPSSVMQTYPYSVYIGKYTKDGNLISNYLFLEDPELFPYLTSPFFDKLEKLTMNKKWTVPWPLSGNVNSSKFTSNLHSLIIDNINSIYFPYFMAIFSKSNGLITFRLGTVDDGSFYDGVNPRFYFGPPKRVDNSQYTNNVTVKCEGDENNKVLSIETAGNYMESLGEIASGIFTLFVTQDATYKYRRSVIKIALKWSIVSLYSDPFWSFKQISFTCLRVYGELNNPLN